MKVNKFKKSIDLIKLSEISLRKFSKNKIYLIDIQNNKSNFYIKECFETAFRLIRSGFTNKMINGPINKSKTLKQKYLGVTEYTAQSFKKKKFAMLIYNKNLSVCPITTHLPLKLVTKKITKKLIKEKIIIVNNFFKKTLGYKPRIGVVGLNPHCESILNFNEDKKIISPVIKSLKSSINIRGPYPSDTIFLKNNRKKFDVIIGMYHDQVLTPFKTLFEYDAINITIGLPFLRVTPDHGPNEQMFRKNKSNPASLINALNFLDNR